MEITLTVWLMVEYLDCRAHTWAIWQFGDLAISHFFFFVAFLYHIVCQALE